MNERTHEALAVLYKICLGCSAELPGVAEHIAAEIEPVADEYCRRFAKTLRYEEPSANLARALIPRVKTARGLSTMPAVFELLRILKPAGDPETTEADELEWLLVGLWHLKGKALWRRGEIEPPAPMP